MPGAVFIDGQRLSLRTVEPEDHDFIHQYRNSPHIRDFFPNNIPNSKEQIDEMFGSSSDGVNFLACRDGSPIGLVRLLRIDEISGRATIAYWIIPDEQGQGYATEATELGVQYAFNERGLHKVVARVFEGNTASVRVLEKVGFQQEGSLRDHYFVDGEYTDAHLYGLLTCDYRDDF